MKLIGLTGKAGCGKDTLAKHLWLEHEFSRVAFADPMKRAAQQIFALTEAQTWNANLKEVVIPMWDLSPRQIFQLLGTEAIKGTFGSDVWIKRWAIAYHLLKDTDHVVVTDVRFDNEAAAIRSLGGIIVEIQRPFMTAISTSDHVSESGLSQPADFLVVNTNTVDWMCSQMDDILKAMK